MLRKWIASHEALTSCLLLALAVLAIYSQTLAFDFVNWDDTDYVRSNRMVLQGFSPQTFWWGLTTFDMSNWHPLTWWSYLLDISLFGPNAAAMHIENAIWHAINSILLYLLFLRATGRQFPSLLLALVFAVHPLHVESVAWIGERKDVLSTFFLLASLWQYLLFTQSRRRANYWLSVVLAGLGMMAKPMLVTLPLLLVIFDYWPCRNLAFLPGRTLESAKKNLGLLLARCVEKWPYLVLAGIDAVLTLLAQGRGGAMRSLSAVPFLERTVNAIVSYFDYIVATFFPLHLSFMYVYRAREVWEVLLSLAVLAGLTWYAVRKRGAALAGWLWFLIALIPVIGLIQVGDQLRADRYMYVPMIGLTMMLFFGLDDSVRRTWKTLPMPARWGLPALILVGTFLAWNQARAWRSPDALFEHALQQNPSNHIAHTMLALHYSKLGQRELALEHADAAINIHPQSPAAGEAANAAASLLLKGKDYALANEYLQTALRADPSNAMVYYNLGEIAMRTGRLAEAVELYAKSIELNPRYSSAYNNLGVAYRLSSDLARAVPAFQRAVELDPDNATAARNLESNRAKLRSMGKMRSGTVE